jgi:hypothetical protein
MAKIDEGGVPPRAPLAFFDHEAKRQCVRQARVMPWTICECSYYAHPDPTGAANAHLIAAAPELYALLREALPWLPRTEFRDTVAAALATAEGTRRCTCEHWQWAHTRTNDPWRDACMACVCPYFQAEPARSDSCRPPDNEIAAQVRRDNGED